MGHTRSHPAFPSLALSWLFTNGFCPFHSINTSLKATVRAKVTFHLSVDPSSWRPLRLWAMQAELWPTPKSGFKKYAKQYYFSYFGFPVFVFLRVKAISYLIEYINFALKKKMRLLYNIKELHTRKTSYTITIYLLGWNPLGFTASMRFSACLLESLRDDIQKAKVLHHQSGFGCQAP